ncbi:hypothetical protein AAFF_G00281570 [Aldrovandia affinis]|uniref:ubiquitinyl hydrolase 1 n=1 Tax=Aldrovandia affinis TaxID=143900 RepID=A0AAD7RAG7_9TELE|nr:hypothetical protein AAFF_G00281570 [Aldrovandia affinis]
MVTQAKNNVIAYLVANTIPRFMNDGQDCLTIVEGLLLIPTSLQFCAFAPYPPPPGEMSQGHSFLPKFLFVSNLLKAMKIREQVPNNVVKPSASGGVVPHLRTMHRHTVEMLPVSHFPPAFCQLVQDVVLDRAMQTSLEQEKKLNWCAEVKSLVPLRTNGDGNCLLHAASQYMLGVQDTDLVLRKALYGALKDTDTRNFRMRFQTQLLQSQEFTQTGLRYSTLNWEEEWEKVVEMASPASGRSGLQYDSLEDIHIFVLSNILRRPIIVIADQVLRSMKSGSSFSPLSVGGIYLPLHWPPGDCYKYPIMLGYNSHHFAPLITVRDSSPEIRAVPLSTPGRGGFEDLKAHFLLEKEQQRRSQLIGEYLELLEIPVSGLCLNTTQIIHAARLDEGNLPKDMDLMEDYLQLVNHEYKRWEEDREPAWQPRPQRPPPFSVSQLSLVEIRCATPSLSLYSETHAMKCKTAGCLFTLSVEHQGLCERCYSARQAAAPPGAHQDPAPHPADAKEQPARGWAQRCSLCHQEALRIFNGLCPACLQWGSRENGGPRAQDPSQAQLGGGGGRAPGLLSLRPPPAEHYRPALQADGLPVLRHRREAGILHHLLRGLPDQSPAGPRSGPEVGPFVGRGPPVRGGLPQSARCRGTGCAAPGLPMCEGYCNMCFVREQGMRINRAGHRAPRGPRSPPLMMRAAQLRQTQNRAQCSRSGCKNASPGWLELCAECQARPRESRRAQAPKETSKPCCRTQGCDHYANQDKHGYCNECHHFKQIYSP